MTTWYYADAAGLQQGPVDAETLLERYAGGAIDFQTLVWRDGLADWQPLSSLAAELGLAEPPAALPGPDPAPPGLPAAGALPADVVYAGFWRRAAANMIDSFAIGLVTLPISLPLLFAIGAAQGAGKAGPFLGLGLQLCLQAFSLLVTVIWFACFHRSRLMASPGKLAVGIKVVRADGSRLGWGRSIGRAFAYYLGFFTLYIGYLIAGFTPRKQALHDLICDTLVVDRWAYTDSPGRQTRGLDTVTIVILSLYALLLVLVIGVVALAGFAVLASRGH